MKGLCFQYTFTSAKGTYTETCWAENYPTFKRTMDRWNRLCVGRLKDYRYRESCLDRSVNLAASKKEVPPMTYFYPAFGTGYLADI